MFCPVQTVHWAGRTTKKSKSHTLLCKSMTLLLGPPSSKGGFYLLWINFLSSPCFTAALSTTQVRNTSMGSIVVFFTRPEVK